MSADPTILSKRSVRTLFVMTPRPGRLPEAEQLQREAADLSPRFTLFERILNAEAIDEYYLQRLPRIKRSLYRLFPVPLVQALEAFRRRGLYDVVLSWDDRFALIYALLLKLTWSRDRHVAILSWMAPPRKAFILRLVQTHVNRIVVWSQTHAALLVEIFGVDSSKVTVIPYFVDQQFWRPMDLPPDRICSAGDSKRDYATLIEAIRDLPLPCRIATQVRPSHLNGRGDWEFTSNSLAGAAGLPENVVIAPASVSELREIYARSHFVVVPLLPSFRDHGITTIAEAMAMGKAVICSRIYGQMDLLHDEKNGMFVPPNDPRALREAILYLLKHPEIAARMGAEGRRRVEEMFALDHFANNVRCIVDAVIKGTDTPVLAGDEAVCICKSKANSQTSIPLSPVSLGRPVVDCEKGAPGTRQRRAGLVADSNSESEPSDAGWF